AQIRVDDFAPLLGRHVHDETFADDPGIVDENVDRPELAADTRDELADRRRVRHIAWRRERLDALRVHELDRLARRRLPFAIANGYRGAPRRQRDRDRAPD